MWWMLLVTWWTFLFLSCLKKKKKKFWFCLRNSSGSFDIKDVKLLSFVHAQWCLTLCDPMDCSLSRSPIHWVLQGRILERHAVSSSRGSSQPRDGSCVSCIGRQILYPQPPGKPQFLGRFPFLSIKSGWKKAVFLWCNFLFGYTHFLCVCSDAFLSAYIERLGLPWCLSGENSTCQCRRYGFYPSVRKIPWRREWQPTPIFSPGKSYGWRSW